MNSNIILLANRIYIQEYIKHKWQQKHNNLNYELTPHALACLENLMGLKSRSSVRKIIRKIINNLNQEAVANSIFQINKVMVLLTSMIMEIQLPQSELDQDLVNIS
jgi:hypothetical protein